MRRALVILSVVAAIAGEAPYDLPRPGAQAPAFNYPLAPAPPPPPPHSHSPLAPTPQFPPQQQYIPNIGYNYPAPNPAPQYIQPAPQYIQPAPQYIQPGLQPQPPHHHHHHHHHPHHPHPAPAPSPAYISSPGPQSLPVQHPQPLPVIQSQPQSIYSQPSPSYGVPQPVAPRSPPQPVPAPIQAFPTFSAQPALQPQLRSQPQAQPQAQVNTINQLYQPIAYFQQQQQQQQQYSQQQYSQQGYNYQQPQAQPQFQSQVQPQFQPQAQQLPAQPLFGQSAAPVLSSYQADSHQYNNAQDQTHRDALDSIVVNRVQNIIKDDEHSVARNAGYLSLVSGVSLEQAQPSVEITSFVHSSPRVTSSGANSEVSVSSGSSLASSSALSPSVDYGVPSVPAPVSSQSAESAPGLNFLPQNKPAVSYGPPN